MIDIERVTKRLAEDEGFRPHAYDDANGMRVDAPVGKLTIGYGANIQDVGLPEPIARLMLQDRLSNAVLDAMAVLPTWGSLDTRRQEVVVEMAYQLGRSRLAGFAKMLKALEERRFSDAADEALDSLAARQAPTRWARHATVLREG